MVGSESAAIPQGDCPFADESFELVCSYDFKGNLIHINDAFERIAGYSRDEAFAMNLSGLFSMEPWERSIERISGNGAANGQRHEVAVLAKNGQTVLLAMTRRLLFEAGRPLAVQDIGYPIPRISRPLDAPAGASEVHFLHTSRYESLDAALDAHLNLGIQILELSTGMLLQVSGSSAVVRAVQGSDRLRPGERTSLEAARCLDLAGRLSTAYCSGSLTAQYPSPEFEAYIRTPILIGCELFGVLSFSSPSGHSRVFSPRDQEMIEALARSIGWFISEFRQQAEVNRCGDVEKSRTRLLEMLAENQSLDAILLETCRLVELQCPASLCSVLLLKDGVLSWSSAPSFALDILPLFKRFRAIGESTDLFGAELRAVTFWEDLSRCPIWAGRAHLATRIGVEACLTAPLLSARGELLGLAALHYRDRQSQTDSDRELLQSAARLAALAIEQRRTHDRMFFEARHDSLTGLPNRSYLIEMLAAALPEAGEQSKTPAVLFIDLDRFKQINDTLGHAMGDRLLKEIGERLKCLLTEDDVAGRMGGDEFAVVLGRQPSEHCAVWAAQEFLNAFRAPHRIEGQELFVTASIGVAIFPRNGESAAELLHNADLAMYHAKNAGKNAVEVFLPENHASGIERLRLENALRRALENGEFDLLYQPVVDMTGKMQSVEALLTWRHPIYGTVSPNQFIPIAEETGLIIEIGLWVLQQACLTGARWHKAGHRNASISVNVSALQFERRDFVDTVATALAVSGFPPRCLELELTESCVMHDLPQSVLRLSQIRELGVSIAIDDFGTGYSSLSYLNKLPVDALKIDQSFLRGIQRPQGSLPVVQTIVRLAHSMNLTVVAEGVETREELDLVRVLGCDKAQGHLFGVALQASAIEALLEPSGNAAVAGLPI